MSFGAPSVRAAAHADLTNGPAPSTQRKISEFGGGDQGRVRALLELQCLALLGAWNMRVQTARKNPPVVGSVKHVKVALQPTPTPLPSHRDFPDLPGSPPWLHAAERRQLQKQSVIPSATAMPAAKPDQVYNCSPSSVVVQLPAVAACESSPNHSPPRPPSYILSAKSDASCRRQPSQGGSGQQRGRSASPVQLLLLDERFKMSQHQKQECHGASSLSPVVSRYMSPNSSTNDTAVAELQTDGQRVAEMEMLRWTCTALLDAVIYSARALSKTSLSNECAAGYESF
jgi:hypothetical protein